jgi:ATP-dependent Clp protease ATP-binding subunit ClpA
MLKEDRTFDEIEERLLDVLTQIRHTKANRPVFSSEFLARIKVLVVFRPLDMLAMIGICQCQCNAMRREWTERRGKDLHIDTAVSEYIGATAYSIDGARESKQGGRVVRKLLSSVVEQAIQRAIAAVPSQYSQCNRIVVTMLPPGRDLAGVEVRFH